MSDKFEFQPDEDGTLSPESAVFQALGAASVCWDQTPHGVFDSTRAKEIGEALLEKIDPRAPRLGYATTQQLLDELAARIRVDYYAGGGGLQYSTVKGRPEGQAPQIDIRRVTPHVENCGCEIHRAKSARTVQPEDMVE